MTHLAELAPQPQYQTNIPSYHVLPPTHLHRQGPQDSPHLQ
jgi:hypothetical protein